MLPIALPPRQPKEGKLRKLLKHLDGDNYALELDWSSTEPMLTCDRAAQYRLIHSRSTYPSPALVYGAALHEALEFLYRARHLVGRWPTDDLPDLINHACASAEHHFLENPPPLTSEWRTFDRLREVVTLYVNKWKDEQFSVLEINNEPMIERSFAQPLGEIKLNQILPFDRSLLVADAPNGANFYVGTLHIVWTGIIDMVIEQNDQLYVLDHKTSSVVGDSFYNAFELSQQFLGYQWAVEHLLGRELAGAVLNTIIGRQKTVKGSGTPNDFSRRFYPYPRHRLDEWPSSILSIIETFVHNLTKGFFPMKTSWCQGKYGQCPFFNVCSLPPQHRMIELMSDNYAPNVWNPLDQGGSGS